MILKFKEGYSNKSILVETIRRAIVRNASEITLSRPLNGKEWRLFIGGKFTKQQKKDIKRYI